MRLNSSGSSPQELSDRLRTISSGLALCADRENDEFKNWVVVFGQWLVEAGNLGLTWPHRQVGVLVDLLNDWQETETHGGPKVNYSVLILGMALEVTREYGKSFAHYVHSGFQCRPALGREPYLKSSLRPFGWVRTTSRPAPRTRPS